MSMFFTIAVIVLVFLVIFQIAKASEYVSILKGDENAKAQSNKINGFLMIVFLVLGLVGVYLCNKALFPKTLLAHESPSVQGEKVDSMLWVTLIITGIVFIITQILLFWFSYKYQENPKRKVFFFPHNNTMELVWTVVPAITLTVLVVIGLRNWFSFTSEAPKDALVVEITGKQFGWMFRYPGKDNIFGKKYFRVINDAQSNPLGQIWADNAQYNLKADPANFDDIVLSQTVYLVKGKPAKFIINSRDVIHDVGLPQFRMKMDAVPGTPTTLWFTPKFTTKEMKEKTGNPDFVYEISCDQMCGNGHYSMKGVIEVVTQEEYDLWMAKQKPNYYAAFPDKDPANQKPVTPAAGADSTKTLAAAK
ncbi:MAG: cytochrome c oxidase subunit II [Filimonas sp.]|nr:cytochrome c oxidase subunit II [Filimonas sp.]